MRRDPGTSPASTAGNTSAWVAAVRGITDNGEEGVVPLPAPVHVFQETSYRIPTPCDACQQQLRGHTRQGLKCKVCKVNIHHNCQGKVTLLQLQTQELILCVQVKMCVTNKKMLQRNLSSLELNGRGYRDCDNMPPPETGSNTLPRPQSLDRLSSLAAKGGIFQAIFEGGQARPCMSLVWTAAPGTVEEGSSTTARTGALESMRSTPLHSRSTTTSTEGGTGSRGTRTTGMCLHQLQVVEARV